MSTLRISKGGQVSLPARIRRRWGASRLLVDDRGDHVVLRPLPDDPVEAATGVITVDEDLAAVREAWRQEDAAAEGRRLARWSRG